MLVVQVGANANETKVFKEHAEVLGLCDNLMNALKLLTNQQKDGGSRVRDVCPMQEDRGNTSVACSQFNLCT